MAPTKKTPTKPTRTLRPRAAKAEEASAPTPKAKKVKTVAPKKEKIVAPKKVTKAVAPKKAAAPKKVAAPKKAPAFKNPLASKETEATPPKKKGRPAKIKVAEKAAPAPTSLSAAVARKILQAAGEVSVTPEPEPTPKPKAKTPKKNGTAAKPAPKSTTKNTPKKIVKSPIRPLYAATTPTYDNGTFNPTSPTYNLSPKRAPKSPVAVKKPTPGRGRPKKVTNTQTKAPAPTSSKKASAKEVFPFDEETVASAQKSMDEMNANHRKLWNKHLKLHKDAEKKGKPNPCPEGQCPGTEPFKPLPLPAALQIGKDLLAEALAQSQSKGVSFLDEREETDSVESIETWTPPKNLPSPRLPKSPRSPAKIKSPAKTKNTPNTISKSPGRASPRGDRTECPRKSPPKSAEKLVLSKTQLALFATRAIAYDNTLEDPYIPDIKCPDCLLVTSLGLEIPSPSAKTSNVGTTSCFCTPPWKQAMETRKVLEKKGFFKGKGGQKPGRMATIKKGDEKRWMIEFEEEVREAMEGFEWKGGDGKTTSDKFGPGPYHYDDSEDWRLW